jgi:hypothetical protein
MRPAMHRAEIVAKMSWLPEKQAESADFPAAVSI